MPADRCESYNPATRNALSSDAHGFTVHHYVLPGFGLHQCNPTHTIWNTLDLGPQQVSDLSTDPLLFICAAELGSTTGPRPGDSTILSGQRSLIRPHATLAKIHGATDLFRSIAELGATDLLRSIAELAHVCILTHLPPIRRRDSSLGQPGQPHACSGIVLVIWTEHACALVPYSWIVAFVLANPFKVSFLWNDTI
jgi:hypothetical protein